MITYCQRDYVNFFFLLSACSLCIGFALVRFFNKKKRKKEKKSFSTVVKLFGSPL